MGPRTQGTANAEDETAFIDLFERTSARVYGYLRRHCDDIDCDDLVSEVYLTAWRRFGELPSDPVPWLLATSRNLLGNHWRGRDRRDRLDAELRAVRQLATAPDPARTAVDRSAMLAAVATLSSEDRELLLLVGWDGLDAAGAAAVLGCSPTAARARLSRARRRLEQALSGVDPAGVVNAGLLTDRREQR